MGNDVTQPDYKGPDAYNRAQIGTLDGAANMAPALGVASLPWAAAKMAGAKVMDPVRAWMQKFYQGNFNAQTDDTALQDAAGPDLERSMSAASAPLRNFFNSNTDGVQTAGQTAIAPSEPTGPPRPRAGQTAAPAPAPATPALEGPATLPTAPRVGRTTGGVVVSEDSGTLPSAQPKGGMVFSTSPDPVGNATQETGLPKKGLPELYAELMGKTNMKVNRDATQQQREEARNAYFANLMHGGPEANPADSVRQAYNASQGVIDKGRAENIDLEKLRIGHERGDVTNIVNASDKEADNARGDKKQVSDEAHARKLEQLKERELSITAEYKSGLLDAKNYELQIRELRAQQAEAMANLKLSTAGQDANTRAYNLLVKPGADGKPGMTHQEAIDRLFADKTKQPKVAYEDRYDGPADAMGNPTKRRVAIDADTGEDIAKPKAGGAGVAATPKTADELKKLPSGTRYINPADGKTYVKK